MRTFDFDLQIGAALDVQEACQRVDPSEIACAEAADLLHTEVTP